MERRVPTRLTPSEGRKFAWTVGAAFLALAGIAWWREHPALVTGFGAVGGLLLTGGLLVPGRLGPVYRAWMGFAVKLSAVTTPIFMGIIYWLVFTPIGLAMRLFGRSPLGQSPVGGSFWSAREPGQRGDLTRQF